MASMREIMREPLKPKRNFLKENKGFIHKIEERNKSKRSNAKEIPKSKKYANVPSKIHEVIHSKGDHKVDAQHKITEPDQCSVGGSYKTVKSVCDEAVQCNELSILAASCRHNKSTQTLNDITELEGIVMTPSERAWRSVSMDSLHLGIPSESGSNEVPSRSHQFTQRTHSSTDNKSEERIVVTGNISWPQKVSKEKPVDPLKAPTTYQKGVVPRYLRERQEEQIREAERALREARDPDCPPGHRKLTEQEQHEGLEKLKATQNQLIQQLNRLPVRLHTLRAQSQRRQLDEELDKIESLIIAFSKSKVFVEQPKDQG